MCLTHIREVFDQYLMSAKNRKQDRLAKKRLERLAQIQREAYDLLESDPLRALAYVDGLQTKGDRHLAKDDFTAIRASLLVDGGRDKQDLALVQEGIASLEDLVDGNSERLDLKYNLANGLSNRASLSRSGDRPWHLLTSDDRRSARLYYAEVAADSPDWGLRSRALTNQANLLKDGFRWLEAFETYRSAVHSDPRNGVASSGAAKLLLWAARIGLGPSENLKGVARRYVELARAAQEEIGRYSAQSLEAITSLPPALSLPDWRLNLEELDPYPRFVAEERLPLSLTIEGLQADVARWDSLIIRELIEPIDADFGVPPTFAALNVLKSDYLAARWACFQAMYGDVPETGRYTDTLDYANYGIRQSLLVQSQKAAIDILDKVAVATTEYLGLGGSPESIYFHNRWHKSNDRQVPLQWQDAIRVEIEAGNGALIALSEMAEDLQRDGYLGPRRETRHAGTHRLVVLHDMSVEPLRESDYILHKPQRGFELLAIDSLRTARAAILYFVYMVAIREARKRDETKGPMGTLFAPPHDWIRGEDI